MFIFEDIKQGCQYDRDYYEIYNNELEEVELLGEPIMLVIQLCRCGIIEDWDYIESIDAVDKFIKKHQAKMITDGQYYINYN